LTIVHDTGGIDAAASSVSADRCVWHGAPLFVGQFQ
jgi:hypothetical protein